MNTIKKTLFTILLGATMVSYSKVLILDQENYKETIESASKPVIIDFYADWCQPCQQMKPIFEELSQKHSEDYVFAQVNFDQNPLIAQSYKVAMLPTFVVINNNKRIGAITGYVTKEQFATKLEEIFNPKAFSTLTSEQQASALRDALMAGDSEQLQTLLNQGVDVNIVFSDGQTPLFCAAIRLATHPEGHVIIKMLLGAGASTKLNFPGQPTMELRDFLKQLTTNYTTIIDAYNKLLPLFDVPVINDTKITHCTDDACVIG